MRFFFAQAASRTGMRDDNDSNRSYATRARLRWAFAAGMLAVLAASSSTAAAQNHLPRAAAIGTNPQGSVFYAAGSVVAEVLSKNLPVNVRVRPFTGTTQFVPLINSGELQLGVNNIHDGRAAYHGIAPWSKFPKFRAIAPFLRLRVGIMVRNNSDIKSLADAKGKRITGNYRAHLISRQVTEAFLALAGLTWDDFKVVPVSSHGEGMRAISEDRADVALAAFNATAKQVNASVPGGIRYLPAPDDPAALKRMQTIVPGSGLDPLPVGYRTGVVVPAHAIGYDVYVTTGASQSADLAYAVAKTLYENEKAMRAGHPSIKARFAKDRIVDPSVTFPYHEGAVRFYREAGLWTSAMEQAQRALLASEDQPK